MAVQPHETQQRKHIVIVDPNISIDTTPDPECKHTTAEWKGTYAQCKRCGAVVNYRHQTVQEATK